MNSKDKMMFNKSLNNNLYFLMGLLLVCVCCLPYFILGSMSYITPHDYLDLTIAHLKCIVNNNLFFSFSGNLPLMDGIDRMSIPFTSPFEIKGLLFYLFPGYWGILFNIVIVKVCAFIGMYLLLEKNITNGNKVLSIVVAIIYSLVPFGVDYSLSSAGIPLLVYAIINIHNSERLLLNYVLTILFALNSALSLSGLFVCIVLFGIIIWLYVKDKQIEWRLFGALSILAVVYTIVNLPLIISFFIPSDIVSHRVEMVEDNSFMVLLRKYISYLLTCQYHAGSFRTAPILLIYLLTTVFLFKKYKSLLKYAVYYFILAILIFLGIMANMIPMQIFSSFQFDRFYFLYPALCFVLLGKALTVLWIEKKKIVFAGALVISVLGAVGMNQEYITNITRILGHRYQAPSFSQFYDTCLFNQIAEDVNIPQDYSVKVVSLGLYPSVASYNGFWCLDGYSSSYPLEYKHKFRRVIAEELNKDEALKTYFDDWGNRCYVFSSELGKRFMYSKYDDKHVHELTINTKELKNLGCKYVFSSVTIDNYKDLNLNYVNTFTSDNSYWKINVYELI